MEDGHVEDSTKGDMLGATQDALSHKISTAVVGNILLFLMFLAWYTNTLTLVPSTSNIDGLPPPLDPN